jgi:hypothetical protein
MPARHPRALCSSLFPTCRMHGPALLDPSLWTPHGRHVTPGASTGAKRVRQLPRAGAPCTRQRPRLLSSRLAPSLALEPAPLRGIAHRCLSRVSCSRLVSRMHWSSRMIATRSPPPACGLCTRTGTGHTARVNQAPR